MNISEQIRKKIPIVLVEISNHLMINGSMVVFPGLSYGKLGISLYFFHYWQYTGNSLFLEYAQYLVDLVKLQIHDDYPLDYERSLAGIGTGLDYLKKNGYYDVDDNLMCQIDAKIIKALSYESRINELIGFNRYLLSRYDHNPTLKDSIIQLIDLMIYSPESIQDVLVDTFPFLCDLYLLDIEKEKIEAYLSDSIDIFINDVQKEPISPLLFTLIKLSQHHLYTNYRQATHDLLQNIITQKYTYFTKINDLQWLLKCKHFLKDTDYQCYIPDINRKITKIITSFNFSKLDDLFFENKNFAFKEGYAGLGLTLISVLTPDNISWEKLFKL